MTNGITGSQGCRLEITCVLSKNSDPSLIQLPPPTDSPHHVEWTAEVQKGRMISSRSHSEFKADLTGGVSSVLCEHQAQAEQVGKHFRGQGSFPSALEAAFQGLEGWPMVLGKPLFSAPPPLQDSSWN